MNENNQCGQTMAKLLPTDCIKEEKNVPSWKDFNIQIE